jgi:hypothetical protein
MAAMSDLDGFTAKLNAILQADLTHAGECRSPALPACLPACLPGAHVLTCCGPSFIVQPPLPDHVTPPSASPQQLWRLVPWKWPPT